MGWQGAAWPGGRWLLSAPEWQCEAREEVNAERSPADSCCWLPLSASGSRLQTHKTLTLQLQQLHGYSCYSMHVSATALIQGQIKHPPSCRVQSVRLSGRRLVRQRVNSSAQLRWGLDLLLPEPRKRVKAQATHGRTSGRALEKSKYALGWWAWSSKKRQREGKKKWIWLETEREVEQARFSIAQHTHWNTTYWDLSQNLHCLTDYEGYFQSILVFIGFIVSWGKFSQCWLSRDAYDGRITDVPNVFHINEKHLWD